MKMLHLRVLPVVFVVHRKSPPGSPLELDFTLNSEMLAVVTYVPIVCDVTRRLVSRMRHQLRSWPYVSVFWFNPLFLPFCLYCSQVILASNLISGRIRQLLWCYFPRLVVLPSPGLCVCVDVYRTTLLPTLTVNIPNANFSTDFNNVLFLVLLPACSLLIKK